ncbi:S-adenosylmethionine synthase [bioreactor metagenome]|uniref:methionine adenosyltransferase n=1 Tax=bioreactor metagenome TaxID=1076179 RepID=A0A645A3D8_9ZZZZ
MSKITSDHIFTSESVSEGHPDKVSDRISDAILDAALEQDPESRVAVETLVTTNLIVLAGELTTRAKIDYRQVALDAVRDIGYTDPSVGFSAQEARVFVALHGQSPDISQGVTEGQGLFKEQGAGDQGIMFGYASDETPAYLPATLWYSHRLVGEFARLRKEEGETHSYLRPDSKSQVSIRYSGGRPVAVRSVVLSHQHAPDLPAGRLEELVRETVRKVIPAELLGEEIRYYVNPTGKFEIGGPDGDTGLTGRKIIVDTYGGVGSHGGGAFSGKDPSKVDRSAAYLARYVAKNIVAAGLARKCEVQLSYAIGVAEPLSINVDTYGTGVAADDSALEPLIRELFPLKPAEIIRYFDLKHPFRNGWRYQDTAAYGHFGRERFPWEKTDRAAALKEAASGLKRE